MRRAGRRTGTAHPRDRRRRLTVARVVVVGGGFAGLSAAARLAKLRHDVTLLEADERLGGQLRGVDREGATWQVHRESVTLPGVFRDLFRKSGRPLERELDLTKIAGRRHIFADCTVLDLPMGMRGDQHDALLETFGRDDWSSWVDPLNEPWDVVRRAALDQVLVGPTAFDAAARSILRPRRSLARVARKGLRDDRLRRLVLDPLRLDGHDPRAVPGLVAMRHYVERNFGLWVFDGGRPALADTLTQRLAQRKVSVHTGVVARSVLCRGGTVCEVVADGDSWPADVVVWCAPHRPEGLVAPAGTPVVPSSRTYVTLGADAPGMPDELLVHAESPLRMWRSSPGQWTIEHRAAGDPLVALAGCGLDLRAHVVARWDHTPSELAALGHWGWVWAGWKSAFDVPGVAPVGGLYFAGAHAHPGGSLEAIGMATAAIAADVGRAPR